MFLTGCVRLALSSPIDKPLANLHVITEVISGSKA